MLLADMKSNSSRSVLPEIQRITLSWLRQARHQRAHSSRRTDVTLSKHNSCTTAIIQIILVDHGINPEESNHDCETCQPRGSGDSGNDSHSQPRSTEYEQRASAETARIVVKAYLPSASNNHSSDPTRSNHGHAMVSLQWRLYLSTISHPMVSNGPCSCPRIVPSRAIPSCPDLTTVLGKFRVSSWGMSACKCMTYKSSKYVVQFHLSFV